MAKGVVKLSFSVTTTPGKVFQDHIFRLSRMERKKKKLEDGLVIFQPFSGRKESL